MSATKIHKTIKKYREKYRIHKESWDKVHKPKITNIGDESHRYQCELFNSKGNILLKEMMEALEGQEVFPKKVKNKSTHN